jgi:hypothetical protein
MEGRARTVAERITTRYLTKYERARVLGTRALQIRYVDLLTASISCLFKSHVPVTANAYMQATATVFLCTCVRGWQMYCASFSTAAFWLRQCYSAVLVQRQQHLADALLSVIFALQYERACHGVCR